MDGGKDIHCSAQNAELFVDLLYNIFSFIFFYLISTNYVNLIKYMRKKQRGKYIITKSILLYRVLTELPHEKCKDADKASKLFNTFPVLFPLTFNF